MLKIMLASSAPEPLKDLSAWMRQQEDVQFSVADSGAQALKAVQQTGVHLVICDATLSDMSGLELVEQLVQLNPLLNTALLSPLSKHDFHEATEGLGVLMQLPLRPGPEECQTLLERLKLVSFASGKSDI